MVIPLSQLTAPVVQAVPLVVTHAVPATAMPLAPAPEAAEAEKAQEHEHEHEHEREGEQEKEDADPTDKSKLKTAPLNMAERGRVHRRHLQQLVQELRSTISSRCDLFDATAMPLETVSGVLRATNDCLKTLMRHVDVQHEMLCLSADNVNALTDFVDQMHFHHAALGLYDSVR